VELPDEALFDRLASGDLAAFDALYARFERPLFGFIHAQLRDRAEAEDVLHEAFMAVLRERAKRTDMQSFRAWLYQTARHLCLNRVRSKKRAGRAVDAAAHVPSPAPVVADGELERRQLAAALERAVARLPDAMAELYRLRTAGMSYDEVAAVLTVPVGTVKSRMHELVKRLRQEIEVEA
jgi:RNA polymerase sigma-70 factor, ECF subfamily